MKFLLILVFFVFSFSSAYSVDIKDIFYVGKMESYNNKFTLYFKTRNKAVLARGENENYINDYPQDLYLFDHPNPLLRYQKVLQIYQNLHYL